MTERVKFRYEEELERRHVAFGPLSIGWFDETLAAQRRAMRTLFVP